MKKIKTFFDTLTKSLTNFNYYKDIEKAKFSFSLKYLYFLFYILSLITSIVFASQLGMFILPNAPKYIETFKSEASSFYPKELVITVKNGEVSTNVKEPYKIKNLLTIDTKGNQSDITNDNTPILVTKNSIVTKDNQNSYKVYPLDTNLNMTIDKKSYDKIISQIMPFLKYVEPGLIVLIILSILVWPFVGAAFSLLAELIYLLIFSSLFFIVAKLLKRDMNFRNVFKLSMHASSLPILLSFIVLSLGIAMPFLLGTAILFVFMILVVNAISSTR